MTAVARVHPAPRRRAVPAAAVVAVGTASALAAAALWSARAGWAPLSVDDARYVHVGLAVLAGDGPRHPLGWFFSVHGPVYPVLLGLGARATGDPFTGARLVGAAIGAAAVGLAVVLAGRLGGRVGALGATVAALSTPLLWWLLPGTSLDLAVGGAVVALLLVLDGPATPARWAWAGVVLGVAVLVKETALPLLLLPVLAPAGRRLRLGAAYAGAFLVTAGWWWVAVWVAVGDVFPLSGLGHVEARPGGRRFPYEWTPGGVLAVVGFAAAWAVCARWRRSGTGRLLLGAAAGLAVPAAYAVVRRLPLRHFAPLALLSCVAVGVAASTLLARHRARAAAPGRADRRRPPGARAAGAAVVAAVVVAVAAVAAGQGAAPPARTASIGPTLARWLDAQDVEPGARVVATKRFSYEVAVLHHGRLAVRAVPLRPVGAGPADPFLWVGRRDDGWLVGVDGAELWERLAHPRTRFLVFTGPSSVGARELADALRARPVPGITHAADLRAGDAWAVVFAVEPAALPAQPPLGEPVVAVGTELPPGGPG